MNGKSFSTSRRGIFSLSFLLAGATACLLLAWQISELRAEVGSSYGAVVEPAKPELEPAQPADTPRSDEPVDDAKPGDGVPDSGEQLAEPAAPAVVVPNYSPVGRKAVRPVRGMNAHVTEHYVIYSQLSDETTYDVARRLEAMYDYYAKRFSEVYSPINFDKLVLLFNNRGDFVTAGGHRTMPGQFMSGGDGFGARLMMIFHEDNIGGFMSSCPLMYHEAFHQFVALEISQAGNINRQWPLWLDITLPRFHASA